MTAWRIKPFRHPRFDHVTEISVPLKCPMCGQEADYGDPYGEPMEILIQDDEMEAKWLLMIGWTCDQRHPTKFGELQAGYFGTVIRHGPDVDNPVHIQDHEYVYLELDGRRIHLDAIHE